MFARAIFRMLSSQYRIPRGFLGRYVGSKMDKLNDRQSDWVISLLDLQSKDIVLDIGFSTGRVLKKISSTVIEGKLFGLDPSETMQRVASERLQNEIKLGQVQLVKGFAEQCPFPSNTFTKIYSVHVVYFWEDLHKVFKELFRILSPHGHIAIYYVSPSLSPNKNFHEYSELEVKNAIVDAGFKSIKVERKLFGSQHGVCILAEK